MAELRAYCHLDRMQPQFASLFASKCRGYLSVEGMASLFVEVVPGIEINRLTDISLKSTNSRPGGPRDDRRRRRPRRVPAEGTHCVSAQGDRARRPRLRHQLDRRCRLPRLCPRGRAPGCGRHLPVGHHRRWRRYRFGHGGKQGAGCQGGAVLRPLERPQQP